MAMDMTNISFCGKREDKNNVERLKKQGEALNLNGQRNITEAIKNLADDPSENNIKFLMNVAQCLRYGVSFDLDGKKPNNDWKTQLQAAAQKAIAKTDSPNKEALESDFKKVFLSKEALDENEKTILDLRNNLLQTKGLPQAMQSTKIDAVKNIAKNLDYFVISTEVSTAEKKECLEKLNHLMSPDYKINSQLKDKKPQVLGELLTDLVVRTSESEKPIIKTTNQRMHGMCVAISVARKLMAYEYKPKYVQQVMNELDANPTMDVFDITKIGTGKKVPVQKTEIDFDYADDKGYRILDASALQWMHIANTYGDGQESTGRFSGFDRKFFDTFHDSHYHMDFKDPALRPHQAQLRALEKADGFISSAKKGIEKRNKSAVEQRLDERFNAQKLTTANSKLKENLKAVLPEMTPSEVNKTMNELLTLSSDRKSKFRIVDAEEDFTKKQKIAAFLNSKTDKVNIKELDERMDNILNMFTTSVETKEAMTKDHIPKSPDAKMKKQYRPLYEAAASYKTAMEMKLDIPELLKAEAKKLDLPETSTKEEVIQKYEKMGKIVPETILRGLQVKYNKIDKFSKVVEKAEVKEAKKDFGDLYVMSDLETTTLDNVAKNLNKMKAEISRELKSKLKELDKPLTELAEEVGKLSGSYWVNKEGESGLFNPQQLRIAEQMIGEYQKNESDIDSMANQVKKGVHSGVSGTVVYHNQHGGHAMYVADVAPLMVKDPKTGKIEIKDAIMHDNTWGEKEHDTTWIDSTGIMRTDYECGRGGRHGYITNNAWQNGTFVDEFKNEIGAVVNKKTGEVSKFRMLSNMTLPSSGNNADKSANGIVEAAFISKPRLIHLTGKVLKGLQNIDENRVQPLLNKAGEVFNYANSIININEKAMEKITSESKLNELKDTNPVKVALNKTTLLRNYPTVDSELTTLIDSIKSVADVQEIEKSLLKGTKNSFKKGFDAKVDINNIDKINDINFQNVKAWIDKTYNPESNEAFVNKFNELKALPKAELEKLIETVSNEDLGINKFTPYQSLTAINNLDPKVERINSNVIFRNALNDALNLKDKNEAEFVDSVATVMRKFESLNNAKTLKTMSTEYFNKYGVRSAAPKLTLFGKEQAKNVVGQIKNALTDTINNINLFNDMLNGKIDNQGYSKEEIGIAIKNTLADLKYTKNLAVKAHVENNYQNKAMKLFNDLIADIKTGGANKDELTKKLENMFEDHHLLNNSTEVLSNFIKMNASKNADEDLSQIYESYLMECIDGAAKLELESEIFNSASKAHLHKVPQMLDTMETMQIYEGDKALSMKTDEGMSLFLEKMMSTGGEDVTVRFLKQTSMNGRAMRAINSKVEELLKMSENLSAENLPAIASSVKNNINLVNALDLSKFPEEAKIKKEFTQKMLNLISILNKFAKNMKAASNKTA